MSDLSKLVKTVGDQAERSRRAYSIIKEAQERIEELESQKISYTCVFCETNIKATVVDEEALREATRLHMLICEKHPMREVERERDDLQGQVENAIALIPMEGHETWTLVERIEALKRDLAKAIEASGY